MNGLELARHYATQDAEVVISGRSDEHMLAALGEQLSKDPTYTDNAAKTRTALGASARTNAATFLRR